MIVRDTLYGIRFRDLNSDLVKNFKGVERFPIDESWKITAKFEAYNPVKEIDVPNVLGQISKEKCPGAVVFERDGKTHRIDAVDEGGDKSVSNYCRSNKRRRNLRRRKIYVC